MGGDGALSRPDIAARCRYHKKKLQDLEQILQLNFANSASLSLGL
jgi:hypothetical protein